MKKSSARNTLIFLESIGDYVKQKRKSLPTGEQLMDLFDRWVTLEQLKDKITIEKIREFDLKKWPAIALWAFCILVLIGIFWQFDWSVSEESNPNSEEQVNKISFKEVLDEINSENIFQDTLWRFDNISE